MTALSMALEGQGITQADFQGDAALLQAILEAQQTPSERVQWAADQAQGKMSEADQQIHLKDRQEFAGLKLKALRFPDFMQLAVLYFYLTSSDILASKSRPLGLAPKDLLALKAKDPKAFDAKLDQAHEMAAGGVLFSDNFRYFSARLFGHVGVLHKGGIHEGAKAAKNLKEGLPAEGLKTPKKGEKPVEITAEQKAAYKAQYQTLFDDYKAKTQAVLIPLLRNGETIEISRPGHFVYLAGVTANGIVVKDVGAHGRKHTELPWETAFDEGWLSSYIAYGRTETANAALDAEQEKRRKKQTDEQTRKTKKKKQ